VRTWATPNTCFGLATCLDRFFEATKTRRSKNSSARSVAERHDCDLSDWTCPRAQTQCSISRNSRTCRGGIDGRRPMGRHSSRRLLSIAATQQPSEPQPVSDQIRSDDIRGLEAYQISCTFAERDVHDYAAPPDIAYSVPLRRQNVECTGEPAVDELEDTLHLNGLADRRLECRHDLQIDVWTRGSGWKYRGYRSCSTPTIKR
jgi:hypothetical protein